ncbi:hypothetical protein VN24_12365 [Paenibacillus beijingensis]|uniref:Uncharacterized protein n=1 Tax=Paenibacillus beijingensis TaxID=1126833 RepID=A0A0D5NIZ2_9BACL|nr:hypothetical protein VN24_12365 [Paenibacillus beijingensis]
MNGQGELVAQAGIRRTQHPRNIRMDACKGELRCGIMARRKKGIDEFRSIDNKTHPNKVGGVFGQFRGIFGEATI